MIMDKNFDKPFVVIDLDSGRYTLENEGHEKYNETKRLFKNDC